MLLKRQIFAICKGFPNLLGRGLPALLTAVRILRRALAHHGIPAKSPGGHRHGDLDP
jgi:hypothetical protein